MRAHLAFQPHDQPRQQDVLQRVAIHLARAGAEFAGLRQAGEPLGRRRRGIDAERQRARLVEQRVDPGKLRIGGDRIERDRLRRLDVGGERRLRLVKRGLVRLARLDQRGRAAECHEQRDRRGTGAHEQVAADLRRVARDQHRLAEDHVLQQPAEEVAAPLFRPQRPRALRIDAEAARHRPGQAVDRRAFLRARRQVGAAQHGRRIEPGAAERLGQEFAQRRGEARDLGREAGDQRAAVRAALGLQPVEQALVQPLDQQPELTAEPAGGAGFGLVEREADTPDLAAPLAIQVIEEFGEAGDQVGLGEQRVDRHAHAKLVVEFLHPAADRAGMRQPLRLRRGGDVGQRDRHQHAVQRLARAGALQQAEERQPARLVHRAVGILRGVAAGGVDQHRGLGEPPVAHARAADAGDRALAHLGGERERQAGVQQRGGLAGAGRPDDRVPRLLVQVAARAGCLLQQRQRRGQLVAHGRHFLGGRGSGGIDLCGGHALDQRGLVLPPPPVEPEIHPGPDQQHRRDDDGAGDPVFQERQERVRTARPARRAERRRRSSGTSESRESAGRHAWLSPASAARPRCAGSGRALPAWRWMPPDRHPRGPARLTRPGSPSARTMIARAASARDCDNWKFDGNCTVWIGWLSV